MKKTMTWRVSGDAGDSVFALALMHALGSGPDGLKHIIRCVDRPGVTAPWTPRVGLVKELFEAQSYVERVEISEEEPDVDLVPFRRWHSATTTLVAAQASEFNVQGGRAATSQQDAGAPRTEQRVLQVDGSVPWMKVKADETMKGKIIIARSPRYNNERFPWRQIVEFYGERLIFVGLPEEHETFCRSFHGAGGQKVAYLRTPTLMEVARAIAGAGRFIGNQSSPHAIALALGVEIISEVSDHQPDCVYHRDNVRYVCDGGVTLPDLAGSGTLEIASMPDIPPNFNTSMVPPGMWQYDRLPPCSHFALQRGLVMQLERCSVEEAEKRLLHHNAVRCQGFFNGTVNDPQGLFKRAYGNAFPKMEGGGLTTNKHEFTPMVPIP